MRLQSQAPKTGFGGLSPAAGVERPKLSIVLQFGQGAARKIAQFCNSEKARNRIALQSCISGKGHPRKRVQFCNSVKLEIANEQISRDIPKIGFYK